MARKDEQTGAPAEAAELNQKLRADQVDLIVGDLDCLPTLPAVLSRLSELARTPTPAGDESQVIRLIGSDPALTARLLSLANASGPERLGAAAAAAERIGAEAMRSAALSNRAFDDADTQRMKAAGLDLREFWRHCLAVACAAEMIAEALDLPIAPAEVYVCGLLHDVGKLALLDVMPKSYARALAGARARGGSICDSERQVIGVDHCVFGRRLAERWRLPEPACNVIWMHHQPIETVPESLAHRQVIAAVRLADVLARHQRLGFSGNCAPPPSAGEAATRLELSEEVLGEIRQRLSPAVQARASLLGLSGARGEALYPRALAQANAELGRLNEQLSRQAEKLGRQAKAFRHMRDFVAALHPDAVIGEILAGVARVLAAAANVTPGPNRPVVAYSVCREDKLVLAARWDGSDQTPWRSLALTAFDPHAAEAPTAAADVLPALLADPEDLDDWLNPSAYEHQALVTAGRWIGGVFYPAPLPSPAAPQSAEVRRAVTAAAALALGIAQGRAKAMLLSEQLAGASQAMAETQRTAAEARALAAVGEMATGAAHELNNPLAVISGRAQQMSDRAKTKTERKVWQLISEQAQRISDVLSELMEFASPAAPQPVAVDVSELLKTAADSFSSSNHPQAGAAKVDITIGADTPPAFADPSQIRGALVEVIGNAAAAAAEGPEVSLAADYDEVCDEVVLTVTDNGPGMDEATAASAFTPFFSLQSAGRRLGMGLPKAKRYVEMNGGGIRIESRPGAGTTVVINLPRARDRRPRRT